MLSMSLCIRNSFAHVLRNGNPSFSGSVRLASHKAGTTTANPPGHARAKHRGLKVRVNSFTPAGRILMLQRTLRMHPGLNVGFGQNGTLFALRPGKVTISCEKIDPKMTSNWVSRAYSGKEGLPIYKKFVNVIPDPQPCRFRLIDEV